MSELSTLHPYDPAFVTRFVAAVKGDLAAGELLPNVPAWDTLAASTDAPPETSRSVAVRSSWVVQFVPQCQHASSCRAIGAWQERHRRGMCRSRMSQRPLVRDAADAVPRAPRESRTTMD